MDEFKMLKGFGAAPEMSNGAAPDATPFFLHILSSAKLIQNDAAPASARNDVTLVNTLKQWHIIHNYLDCHSDFIN
jgi:hypothetical protein